MTTMQGILRIVLGLLIGALGVYVVLRDVSNTTLILIGCAIILFGGVVINEQFVLQRLQALLSAIGGLLPGRGGPPSAPGGGS